MNVILADHSLISPSSTPPTLWLKVLGGLALTGTAEPAELRRRQLALLAILATAGDRGVSRERLHLYLWPESDTRRARNALNQTLYAVRRDLHDDHVVTGGAALTLNPALLGCDLWEFERALAAGDLATAVGAYGGPFLDDFAVPGLPEFERWADDERTRHAGAYRGALERLATAAEADGDAALALRWWRQLGAAAPVSATAACGVIRALAATGDRAAALEHARAHVALVRTELGADPDPTVIALVERLRVTPPAPAVAVSGAPSDSAGRVTNAAAAAPTPVDHSAPAGGAPRGAQPESDDEGDAPPARPRTRPRRLADWLDARWGRHRRSVFVAGGVAAGLLVSIVIWWLVRPTESLAAGTPLAPRVVIFPFTVAGADSARSLGTGMVNLLAASLDGAEVEPVDPRAAGSRYALGRSAVHEPAAAAAVAERLRAESYVLGEAAVVGGRVRLSARWFDREDSTTTVSRATVEGPSGELFALVDRLTGRLLAGRGRGPDVRLTRAAAENTRSLAALKAYLAGQRAMWAGEYASAVDHLQRAVHDDTAFALGHYALSVAAEWAGRDSLARASIARAARFVGPLDEHYRRLVLALAEFRAGNHATAEHLYYQIVDDYADDAEAWFQLGELLFHTNPLHGRSATEARLAFEQVMRLEPDNEEVLAHLARIASIEGRKPVVDSIVRRLLAGKSAAGVLELRAFRSFALGDRDRQKQVTNELQRGKPPVHAETALDAALYRDDLEGAEELARELLDEANSPDVRALGFRMLARTSTAHGRWTDAAVALDSAQGRDSVAANELRAILVSLPFLQLPRAAVAGTRAAVAAWRAPVERWPAESHSMAHYRIHPHLRLHRVGLLGAALGDEAAAGRAADSIAALPLPPSVSPSVGRVLAQSIRASAAFAAGRPAEAVAIFERTPWPAVAPVFEAEARDRFIRAEALHALGRDDEALGWYESIAERAAYELVYLAPSELRQGEIHDRRGDVAEAARHYGRFVELWAHADAPLQPTVDAARRRLAALQHAARATPAR